MPNQKYCPGGPIAVTVNTAKYNTSTPDPRMGAPVRILESKEEGRAHSTTSNRGSDCKR